MLRQSNHRRNKLESGMVLAMALLLMAAAAFVVTPGLWAAGTMLKINLDAHNRTKAYYAAKAGIADVFYKFKDPNYTFASYPLSGNPINGMTVSIAQIPGTTIVTSGTKKTYPLQSTATLNGITLSTVYSTIEIDRTSGYPFEYALATTGGEIHVDSNAFVHSTPTDGYGNIFANGKLDVNGTGRVYGSGFYTTEAEGCEKITGGCTQTTPKTFQPVDLDPYLSQAKLGNPYPTSPTPPGWPNLTLPLYTPYGSTNLQINGNRSLGGAGNTSYINGNLELLSGANVILYGTVWVNGYIVARANSNIRTDPANPSKQYYLLTHGSQSDSHYIELLSNSHVYANNNLNLISDNGTITIHSNVGWSESNPARLGIIYAPNGQVTLESNSYTNAGAILGKSIELNSNSYIYYNMDLANNPPMGWELNTVTVNITGYSGQ